MIILLGFPKSGTFSFQKLFTDLGYNSFHQIIHDTKQTIGMMIKNNKKNKKPLLAEFKPTDCITQLDVCFDKNNACWPQITDFKQIYAENSDSIFILNKRDPIKLLSSFKRWNNLFERFHKYNPEILKTNTDAALLKVFKTHYKNVETFFSALPEAKFISFDIEHDNLEKLRKYIDTKDIKCFPRENVNTKTG